MFEKLISKIAKNLKKHNIPYIIIGGQAVLLYGEPRLTRDIDITLGINTEHLYEILTILHEIHLKPLPENTEAFVNKTMVLPTLDINTSIRIDFIFSFTPYEIQAISRAKKIIIMNEEVCFASPEDVIIHKIFAGRPKDIEDARTIILKNSDIDINYICDWLKQFDAISDEKKFLITFEKLLKN